MKITQSEAAAIALDAGVHFQTLYRYLAGGKLRTAGRLRIERVLASRQIGKSPESFSGNEAALLVERGVGTLD
jgi:hypothetical protein